MNFKPAKPDACLLYCSLTYMQAWVDIVPLMMPLTCLETVTVIKTTMYLNKAQSSTDW